MRKAQRYSDPTRLMDVVANYMFGSSFVDSHRLDHVNFFCPRVIVPIAQPNVIGYVGMQQSPCCSSACLPLVS